MVAYDSKCEVDAKAAFSPAHAFALCIMIDVRFADVLVILCTIAETDEER